MAEDRPSHLDLSVDQLDLLLHFLQHLGEPALLENGLCLQEVLFGLLRLGRVVDHAESANDLVGLRNVDGTITVQCRLQLLQHPRESTR